jgi:hypothetical protein
MPYKNLEIESRGETIEFLYRKVREAYDHAFFVAWRRYLERKKDRKKA